MSRNNLTLAVAGTACLLAARLFAQEPPANPAAAAAPAPNSVNDTARLLAGLAPAADPAAVELAKQSSWQQHAKSFDSAWVNLEKNQLGKVRTWAKANIADAHAAKGTVFYMFSGPDFLYADTFYPQATTYVLCGLEPVGKIPDLSKLPAKALGGELHALQGSINTVLNLSFFITKQMQGDLQNHSLSGTLPLLYIFLERSGKTPQDVSYVSVDEEGTLTTPAESTARSSKNPASGVRIRFLAEGSDTVRTLYYFCTDISDGGLKHSGFLKFCKTLAPGNGCVKSASYLMHESEFSTVRSFLLENATTLVQDDSGIPVAFFKPDTWQLRVFGHYPGPISLFKNCYQPKLAEYYKTTKPEPLDFGIGYRHHSSESTLMVAARKPAAANDPPPAATPNGTTSSPPQP